MTSDLLLRGQKGAAFVAGAGGGIGAAVSDHLLSSGIRVAGTSRRLDRLATKSDVFLPLAVELVKEEAVASAISQTAEAFGRIDYVINMAGIVGKGPLVDMTLNEWCRVLDVNLTSCFLIAKYAHPFLKDSGGTLIMCSSTNGLNGGSFLSGPAYASSKAAIINLNRYLAKEWASDGIRVNCVVPGPVDTPMLDRLAADQHEELKGRLPLGRYVRADEVAKTVAFLCSDAAAAMTGTYINISSGLVLD